MAGDEIRIFDEKENVLKILGDMLYALYTFDEKENVLTILRDPVLAPRVSKFLLATGELLQIRHLNSVADGVDDTDNIEAALVEDSW